MTESMDGDDRVDETIKKWVEKSHAYVDYTRDMFSEAYGYTAGDQRHAVWRGLDKEVIMSKVAPLAYRLMKFVLYLFRNIIVFGLTRQEQSPALKDEFKEKTRTADDEEWEY